MTIQDHNKRPDAHSPSCPECDDDSLVAPMQTLHRGADAREAVCQFCGAEFRVEDDEEFARLWFGHGAYEQREWDNELTPEQRAKLEER